MVIGGFGGFVPVALIPFSMFLKGEYLVFAFLSIVLSSTKIFLSLMSVEIMIAVNRTVDMSHRGTMQGFCSLGGSIAKAAGPVFGGKYQFGTGTEMNMSWCIGLIFFTSSGIIGALVSFCYHSFLPRLGGVIIFVVLALIGFISTLAINFLDKDFYYHSCESESITSSESDASLTIQV
mmetsp:Transcript_15320/g.22604  ORF Transcript_15320/g.22604 Transcript_15320/m.22604 type:complete len:178 (-) Transcript_15320:55-588(-)